MTNPLIIKLGGILLENEEALNHLFSSLRKYRIKCQRFVIIIHGGGCLVDKLMKKLSLPVIKKDGLRITSYEQVYIITGALAGTANKILLAYAKKHGLNPIGLCLSDDNLVNVRQSDKELGYVGHVSTGNCSLLNNLLNFGYIPIVSSIGITDEGVILNTNADQAATALAATINADLILLSDVSGILDSKGNCISEITVEQAEQLIAQGTITNGMIVKVNAAINAARILSRPVNIASWRHFEQLLILNLSNSISFGTKVSV